MADIDSVEERVNNILNEVKDVLDEIIEIRKESKDNKQRTAKILETFLSELYQYIKEKSVQSRDNLMSGISLVKIKR